MAYPYTYKAQVIDILEDAINIKLDFGFRTYQNWALNFYNAQFEAIRASDQLVPANTNLIVGNIYNFRTFAPGASVTRSSGQYTLPNERYSSQLRVGTFTRYIYKAIVTQVIDGDTFDCMIDVGFNLNFGMRVRMQGINAPAITGTTRLAGIASKVWLESQILGQEVALQSFDQAAQTEKYGRYLAVVYRPNQLNQNGLVIASEINNSINAQSINAGKSVYYAGYTEPENVNIFNRS